MSQNAQDRKNDLKAKVDKFSNSCHGADGRFCETHGVTHEGTPNWLSKIKGLRKKLNSPFMLTSKLLDHHKGNVDDTEAHLRRLGYKN